MQFKLLFNIAAQSSLIAQGQHPALGRPRSPDKVDKFVVQVSTLRVTIKRGGGKRDTWRIRARQLSKLKGAWAICRVISLSYIYIVQYLCLFHHKHPKHSIIYTYTHFNCVASAGFEIFQCGMLIIFASVPLLTLWWRFARASNPRRLAKVCGRERASETARERGEVIEREWKRENPHGLHDIPWRRVSGTGGGADWTVITFWIRLIDVGFASRLTVHPSLSLSLSDCVIRSPTTHTHTHTLLSQLYIPIYIYDERGWVRGD